MKFKSKFLKRKVLLAFAILLGGTLCSSLYAESSTNDLLVTNQTNRTIKGKVTDAAGEPLIGVSVVVEGTTNGTMTDVDGFYSINVSEKATRLRFSYVGYTEQVIQISKSVIDVVLRENEEMLSEVVVVGYGVQKKETLSGAIAVVDSKAFEEKGGLSSPLQALQGQVAGVMVTRSSSAPGDEGWSMSLRGASSKNSTEPLVVIDGVASGSVNDLRNLNSNDIETISFLKDGSAAIYGSRAAGGVVLITTKKGAKGKTKIEYSGSATLKTVGLMPSAMSIDQWSDGVMTALRNDDKTSDVWYTFAELAKKYKGSYIDLATSNNPFGTAAFTDVSDFVFDNDANWLDSLFGDTWSTEQNLSVSGGSDRSSFRVSFSYLYDGSTLQYGNNKNQRYNFRVNNTYKLSDKVTLESSISYNRQQQVTPTSIGSVLTTSMPMPGLPFRSQNGKAYAWGTWGSPVAKLEEGGDNKLSVSAININESLKYNITDWLNATGEVGYNTNSANRSVVENSITYYNYAGNKKVLVTPTQASSSYLQTDARTDFYSFSGYLNAHRTFAKKHNFSLTAGAQYEFKEYVYYGTTVKGIQDGLEIINGSGEVKSETNVGKDNKTRWQTSILSYFGRFNYDYDQRYLFELNGRYDGVSKFQPENRWDFFWGTSLGWRIQQEAFLKDVSWLHDLKLRLSYAEVGNQSGVGNYDGVIFYDLMTNSGAYLGSNNASYFKTDGNLATKDRKWERVKNYNIALDFGFLGGSLSGTVDLFMKRNNNMLIDVSYPAILGDKAPTANKGKFKTWGVDGNLSYRGKIGDFNYHAGGTLTFVRDKLVDNGGTTVIRSGFINQMQGYPLKSVFGLRYAGKIQNEEQLAAYHAKYYNNNGINMPSNLRVGDNMYCDENGDGVLDEKDFIHLGSDTPEISYSFNFGASYKGIDINVIFQGAANRFVYRGIDNWTVPFRANYTNTITSSIGNTWNENNRDAYYAPYTNDGNINNYNYQASTLTAQDGRYLRLKNITVGYTFPRSLLMKTKSIEGARIYVTGADLWETTKIKDGWDPEAVTDSGSAGKGVKRYPFTRNFTFGLNLTF
ncbi:SusC/RagA family TonB-linked outer membrane protein [Dysgonomonas sp. 511]|uniref:SusC/RagA family TonB-linked outer membrane protein n=1 Tax=Dysgonomonas sp. 511 TaxID=2302930 RepID=UPI0034CF9F87